MQQKSCKWLQIVPFLRGAWQGWDAHPMQDKTLEPSWACKVLNIVMPRNAAIPDQQRKIAHCIMMTTPKCSDQQRTAKCMRKKQYSQDSCILHVMRRSEWCLGSDKMGMVCRKKKLEAGHSARLEKFIHTPWQIAKKDSRLESRTRQAGKCI